MLAMAIFIYALLVSALVQFLILPHVFPAWHAGNGLLAGGDMPAFHQLAVVLAEKIQSQGWSAWTLRPAGQAPAGIAAALYSVIAPEPWTMIPIYAALHALAGVLLARILLQFDRRWKVAVLGILPLVLFPSAAWWYTQLGKDSFSIAGYLAIVLGWLTLTKLRIEPRLSRILLGPLLILGGAGLAWIVRPYLVEILQALSGVAALAITFLFARSIVKRRLSWPWAVSGIVVAWLTVIAMSPLALGGFQISEAELTYELDNRTEPPSNSPDLETPPPEPAWSPLAWLKDKLDSRVNSLADARIGFTTGFPNAGSNLDVDTEFRRASDVLAYVPRATVIAFLYPTPIEWLKQGTLPQTTLMRRISGLEMTGVYFALVMLPYALWRWRRQPETWLMLLFSLGMMLVLALVVANLGTLYRMRYPYLMSLVGLSVAAAAAFYLDWRAKSAKTAVKAVEN